MSGYIMSCTVGQNLIIHKYKTHKQDYMEKISQRFAGTSVLLLFINHRKKCNYVFNWNTGKLELSVSKQGSHILN